MLEVNDRVNIYFDTTQAELDVMILYIPVASGDSWHVVRKDGTLVYVQMFAKMEQVK
jgi:hypothetical protein